MYTDLFIILHYYFRDCLNGSSACCDFLTVSDWWDYTVIHLSHKYISSCMVYLGICIVVICVLRKKKSARTAEGELLPSLLNDLWWLIISGTTEESTSAELRYVYCVHVYLVSSI